jgi:hypothetical protein
VLYKKHWPSCADLRRFVKKPVLLLMGTLLQRSFLMLVSEKMNSPGLLCTGQGIRSGHMPVEQLPAPDSTTSPRTAAQRLCRLFKEAGARG